MTIGAFVSSFVDRFGADIAIVTPDGRWAFGELGDLIVAVARGLLAIGVEPGDRVGVLMPNCAEWVAASYGTALIGGVAVFVNVFSPPAEQHDALAATDASVVLMSASFGDRDLFGPFMAAGGDRMAPRQMYVLGWDGADAGAATWSELLAAGAAVAEDAAWARAADVRPDDDGFVMFTSGTSGRPKAVVHAHRAPCLQLLRWAEMEELNARDRVFSTYPWFWSSGFVRALGACLSVGARLVTMAHFEPAGALRLMDQECVDTVITPGQGHLDYRLIEDSSFPTTDLRTVRRVSNRPLAVALGIEHDWLGAGYGMSESCTLVTVTRSREPAGTAGRILPGWSLAVIDPENGALLPRGQTGLVKIKGPAMMTALNGRPLAEVVDADGYFVTSDLGWLDDDGNFFFSSRIDDLVRSGGVNVSTGELERVLAGHDGVKHVIALGVPHPRLGQALVACIVRDDPDLESDDILAWLRPRLASYKLPRAVLFFDESELTFTVSQKVERTSLRDAAIRRLDKPAE
ncbi:MAG TPA: class I adenylate-forming enzyme family protein [Acidimicrobiales bacterium]|nr:class I adenylate-forming enzyme family protein [Acidimicrobiales bacterium]